MPPRKNKARSSLPSTHGMRTRARAKVLDLMNIPPEVRNIIYAHMYGREDRVAIKDLHLPSSLRVPGVFTEALPVFFESTPISIAVRSNWCIRNAHLHKPGHDRYDTTGKFEMSQTLSRMPESVVRFRNVSFFVSCCCCDKMRDDIARIDIESVGQGISCEKSVECRFMIQDEKPQVIKGFEDMLEAAEKLVKTEIKSRDGFNGFSIADLERIAMCFRDTFSNDHDDGHGEA